MKERTPLKPIKRDPLLYEIVRQRIVDYILANKLQPGEKLPPESELARQLQVSRASVREGIKALEVVGIVRIERGSGVYIEAFSFDPLLETLPYGFLFDLDQLSDLWKIRQILEIALIEEAIHLMTADRLAKLNDVVNTMHKEAVKGRAFPEQDRKFHQILFEHLNNRVLLKLLDTFWLTFRKAMQHTPNMAWDVDPMNTYKKHKNILDAIEAKNIEEARKALTYHYDDLTRKLGTIQAANAENVDDSDEELV
ncbi:FadR family transcriptional regulator [Phototrophicus methaneseepsis]|uniref:FadR family transcriptional regulator n=1 Tax=Phototrophicus methaneseepsis TaxID=2710758 RepID=A0A7S8E541_9CHLR|nr:FadR/GntR family transcriptional regulator [Phototrophicus methaneseepsis]QPC80529.1 FadR family transcriptional regulator [Phototrophicus methaneseepsis]